jgi:hypothetical protein
MLNRSSTENYSILVELSLEQEASAHHDDLVSKLVGDGGPNRNERKVILRA